MTRTTHRLLATTTALAAALAAVPARADHDRRDEPRWHVATAPSPAYSAGPRGVVVVPAPAVAASFPYRRAHWRPIHARALLRQEYHRLELARDRFYATWDGRPWERGRFESWYAARRSDLDQRWAELERGRDRW